MKSMVEMGGWRVPGAVVAKEERCELELECKCGRDLAVGTTALCKKRCPVAPKDPSVCIACAR